MFNNNKFKEKRHSNNACFSLESRGLTIHVTDVVRSTHPRKTTRIIKSDKMVQYAPVSPTSPTSKRWRRKLGEGSLQVLHLGYYNTPDYIWERQTLNIKCHLTRFPTGYHLYSRNEGTGPHHSHIRNKLLYGDGKQWQSPNEARLHIAWLMSNMPRGKCKCIRCGPEREQKKINKEFKKRWRAYEDERTRNRYAACHSGEA